MKTLITMLGVAAAILAIGGAQPAWAGANPNAVFAVHVGAQINKGQCDVVLPDCGSFVVNTSDQGSYNLYLTVANYDSMGIAGVQFGIDYDNVLLSGIDVEGWTPCSDLEFANEGWPGANSGDLLTWEYNFNCQIDPNFDSPATAIPVLIGVLQVTAYSADTFRITPRPVDGRLKVADCLGAEDDITDALPNRMGTISFGGTDGYNPCEASVPTRPTTWGNLKNLYRN